MAPRRKAPWRSASPATSPKTATRSASTSIAGSEAEARDAALKYCQSHGSDVARAKCEIFATFHNQCAAEAEDPQPGTPGAGWAIAADKAAAEKMAMMNCLATAGDRGSFCKVVTSVCDGK